MASSTSFSTSTMTYGTTSETYSMSTASPDPGLSSDTLLRKMQEMTAQMEKMDKKIQEQAQQILGLQKAFNAENASRDNSEERIIEIIEAKAFTTLLGLKFAAEELSRRQDDLVTRVLLLEGCLGIQQEALNTMPKQSTPSAPHNSPRHNPEVSIHTRPKSGHNIEEHKRSSNSIEPAVYYESVNLDYFSSDTERARRASGFTSTSSTGFPYSTSSSSGTSSSSSSSNLGRSSGSVRQALSDITSNSPWLSFQETVSSSVGSTSSYTSSSSSHGYSSNASLSAQSLNPFNDGENVQPQAATSSYSSGTSSSSSSSSGKGNGISSALAQVSNFFQERPEGAALSEETVSCPELDSSVLSTLLNQSVNPDGGDASFSTPLPASVYFNMATSPVSSAASPSTPDVNNRRLSFEGENPIGYSPSLNSEDEV